MSVISRPGYIYTISPTLINELQVGYQRRNDSIYPATANQGWAGILGIPGVGPQTFPGLVASGSSSFTWTANPGGGSRTINEDVILADNVTKVHGAHTLKFGYQGIRQRENDISGVAAVRNLHVSFQPQRQSTDAQYRKLLCHARTRRRVGRELHAAAEQLSAPLVAESILCAGRLENSPRSDPVDRTALQPGVAGRHAVRAEIGVRSECDRSR